MVTDSWFPAKPKREQTKTLIVLDPQFFMVVDKDWRPTFEVSESVLRQAVELFDKVVLVPIILATEDWAIKVYDTLCELMPEAKFRLDTKACRESDLTMVETLRRYIIEAGGEVRKVKNPREISTLNIHNFLVGRRVTIIRGNGWEKVGITPEKHRSFQDAVEERRKTSFW